MEVTAPAAELRAPSPRSLATARKSKVFRAFQKCPTLLPARGRKQGWAGWGPKPVQLRFGVGQVWRWAGLELDRFGPQTCPTLLPAPGRKQGWAGLEGLDRFGDF